MSLSSQTTVKERNALALNIVLAAAVVAGMVALFLHAIRSERRHHQLQAEASYAEALRANAP